jgi:hypothetical protein
MMTELVRQILSEGIALLSSHIVKSHVSDSIPSFRRRARYLLLSGGDTGGDLGPITLRSGT